MSLERKVRCYTDEGLPIVSEKTFLSFLSDYAISAAQNDPTVTARIKQENPQIHRLLRIGMENAPSREARSYYECGVQIAYELLRRESKSQQ